MVINRLNGDGRGEPGGYLYIRAPQSWSLKQSPLSPSPHSSLLNVEAVEDVEELIKIQYVIPLGSRHGPTYGYVP
jgi:hypothetical protein